MSSIKKIFTSCFVTLIAAHPDALHAISGMKKTVWTTLGGCAAGFAGGTYADSKDRHSDKNSEATVWKSSAVGCVTGAVFSYFFYGDEEQKRSDELSAYKNMDRNEGRIFLDKDNVLTNGPDRSTCQGDREYLLICTGPDGAPGSCDQVGFSYLSSHWAVQYIAFYSKDGCFPAPFTKDNQLKNHFNLLEKSILLEKNP